MTFLPHNHVALAHAAPAPKKRRRTATSVLAGDFDRRPQRDILTSLLNGVKPYRPPMSEEETRERELQREKKREKHRMMEEDKARKRDEKLQRKKESDKREALKIAGVKLEGSESGGKHQRDQSQVSSAEGSSARSNKAGSYSFWQPRSTNVVIIDPTPEPSDNASSTSHSSSRCPDTPFDDVHPSASSFPHTSKRKRSPPAPRPVGRPPKKRRTTIHSETGAAPQVRTSASVPSLNFETSEGGKRKSSHKKGWKGWVEADEEEIPGDKLIKLDLAVVLEDRRTRSGKNFDAIGEGKESWI